MFLPISGLYQQKRAMDAEYEAADAYKQIDKLKRKHENEINALNQLVPQSHILRESSIENDEAVEPSVNASEQEWRDEFEPLCVEVTEFSKLSEASWFSGYDRCNI